MVSGLAVENGLNNIDQHVGGFPQDVITFCHYLSIRINVGEDNNLSEPRAEVDYTLTPQKFIDRTKRTISDLRTIPQLGGSFRILTRKTPQYYDSLEEWIPAIAKAMFPENSKSRFGEKVDRLYHKQKEQNANQ